MKMLEPIHISEPTLEFRYGQAMDYPGDGLYLFGPVDAQPEPRQVRYGVIGTPGSVRRFKEWAASVSTFIDVPAPRRGSKHFEPHHVAFPGLGAAFHASWSDKPHRIISDIDEAELHDALRISHRHEAIKAAVDIFFNKLVAAKKRDEDGPSFWYVVIPEFIYQLGTPMATVPPAERREGTISVSAKRAAKLEREPTLFGDEEREAEIYKYAKNFRRQLKARLLDHQIVTQIVRETTLTPSEFLKANSDQPKRRLEDPATVAWKLATGSYYKSGGRPWQIANVRPGVCYVGLVYKHMPTPTRDDWACCAAQMFLTDGEGVVFRGALGPWFRKGTKQFHLDHAAALSLASQVIEEYRERHGRAPDELFIHAKSAFDSVEWGGFQEACRAIGTNVVGVQIADAWDQMKLYRPGSYPTIRGTAVPIDERSAYLWTSGYVPRLDTYMGPDTPNPLLVAVRRGKADLKQVLSDVMSLTKINFNTCLFNDRLPVTIKFADAIGDILGAAPLQSEPVLPFKFYV